jgi:hypothetical protein
MLLALLFASTYIRQYIGAKRWLMALDYAEIVVNAIDQLYETGDVGKDDRLEAAMDQLTASFPWLKTEEAHTMIHGWLGMINKERAETFADSDIVPAVMPIPADRTP